MTAPSEWVLLAYRLPREPSTPRIALWRKLRRLGVLQLVDGLVALPASARTREHFDWLADEVLEAGGEAWTWLARPASRTQEKALTARLAGALADEYQELLAEAEALAGAMVTRRTVERLRRELHRIVARDHIGLDEREDVRRAVDRLAVVVDAEAEAESLRQ